MFNWLIFWTVAALFGVGHTLLVRSAVRLRRSEPIAPESPRSTPTADLTWTVVTALATAALLYAVYLVIGVHE
ncbi:MAG: hypothetical protein HC822_17150 [Oscillochloris sp.]|nr:hypothetical protein [Oscillochloris sp.]